MGVSNMKMSKNEALCKLSSLITDMYLKPVIDRCMDMDRPAIKVDKSLYDNDYMEWQAKKDNKLTHI